MSPARLLTISRCSAKALADSIDALELVLEIERTFGVAVGDEETAKRVLKFVNSIAEFINETRG